MRPRISLGSYLLSSVLGGCLKAAKESRGLKAGLTLIGMGGDSEETEQHEQLVDGR